MSMLLTKNVIERPIISVKHLTPPPFQGRRSRVAVGVEEASAAGISATLGRAHQARYQLDVDGQTLADCSLPCASDNSIGADVFLNRKECSIARYLVNTRIKLFIQRHINKYIFRGASSRINNF